MAYVLHMHDQNVLIPVRVNAKLSTCSTRATNNAYDLFKFMWEAMILCNKIIRWRHSNWLIKTHKIKCLCTHCVRMYVYVIYAQWSLCTYTHLSRTKLGCICNLYIHTHCIFFTLSYNSLALVFVVCHTTLNKLYVILSFLCCVDCFVALI